MFRCTKLDWGLHPDMVEIGADGDGSCFFHSVSLGMFKPYQREKTHDGQRYSRREHVVRLRTELSHLLPAHYNNLSRGALSEFSKTCTEYTMENMQRQLMSNEPVDNVYNEYISNILKIDLYIMDGENKKVMVLGDDSDILYRNRNSVVLIYRPGHYNLVGIDKGEEVQTFFLPDNEFIKSIRKQMSGIISGQSEK
mgnify:CR=1 FL=1